MSTKEIFKRLALPKHTDAVYELLREEGPMIASGICEKMGAHRPAVYRALSALLAQRFIFVKEQGRRKVYHAASPRLITLAFAKAASDVSGKIEKQVIADDLYKQKEIRFLHGFNGIRAAFDDVITHTKNGETFYRYTSEKNLDAVNKYLSKNYRALRDKKKLERMVISNPISGTRKKPRLERFIKFISSETSLFDQNIIQLIYSDYTSLIDLNTERVLIIKNKELADFQKVIFKQLYDKLALP